MKRLLLLALTAFLAACNQTGGEIEGVKSFKFEGGAHKPGRLEYAQRPPAGGEHNSAWQNCGVYERPIYDEYAVHSLEHGAVWVYYRPDVATSQVLQLREVLDGRTYTLLSPHETQKAPIVLSAWKINLMALRGMSVRLEWRNFLLFAHPYRSVSKAPRTQR